MQDVLADYDALLLPDLRLTKRVRSFLERAWADPSCSLPEMLQDSAQLEGAYRLLNNPRVASGALLLPHVQSTSRRAKQAGDVVVVSDTTSVETLYADPEEVGYLNTGVSGYQAHVSLAMSVEPNRPPRPLGVVSVEAVFRSKAPQYTKKKKKPASRSKDARSTDKAFLRWERGIENSSRALQGCSSVIHVADREADSFPLFCKVLELGDGCVFRLRNDRRARPVDDNDDDIVEPRTAS
jgi:Transposase DNA-binding